MHAMLHPVLHVPEFDEPRREDSGRPDLWIGPQRDPNAPLLEIMAERIEPDTLWVFHVMPARPKFLALLDQEDQP